MLIVHPRLPALSRRVEGGTGKGRLRQTQAWLHTWCGLWFSWLLFAVFLTGTLAVFQEPITHWMTPEHHAEEAAAEPKPANIDRARRLAWGGAYMATHHPDAPMWELWPSDADGGGALTVYWFDERRQYVSASLDPSNGQPLIAKTSTTGSRVRATFGGHHFVDFHYELHAGPAGLWIVGIAAMAMLVALVSGVVTHKRIFTDFFTFRPGKGQRSWLDAHNVVAVLTLPFLFMIAYTGIAISGATFMPAPRLVHYGMGDAAQQRLIADLNGGLPERSGRAMPVPDLEPFAARGQVLMGQPVRAIVIEHPGDAAARIGVYGWNGSADALRRLSPTSGMATFSAATGELQQLRLPGGNEGGIASLTQSVMGGLHMASFGGWAVKWLYFLCGLAGAATMATGAILFMVKRRAKHLGEFGGATARVYRVIEALNVASIAGLAIACIGYLWANRLLPVLLEQRAAWELRSFFALWLLALLHAFARPPARAWREQLQAFGWLCLLLPVVNVVTTGDHLLAQLRHGDWESAGVELAALAFAALAFHALRVMHRRDRVASARTLPSAA